MLNLKTNLYIILKLFLVAHPYYNPLLYIISQKSNITYFQQNELDSLYLPLIPY